MTWQSIEDFEGFSEPSESLCSAWQISIIESLLPLAALDQNEKDVLGHNIESYTEQEAKEIINYLKDNKVENEPRKQWVKWIQRK